ncbi:S8 family serine peptidase [uncultured Marivita sp.]|uniref:S8 family serine peptidase n=1 Tax=uncultured Marivita sp. TaxID=888080 RepID=UPI00261A15E9|nr:S8 family serine peptidase [uncultured Marivita sp.]
MAKGAKKCEIDDAGLHYLWHLIAINLMTDMGEFLEGQFPKAGTRPEDSVKCDVKVAIIDNGACDEHPNLLGLRMTERADFSSWASLTSYYGHESELNETRVSGPFGKEKDFFLVLAHRYGFDAEGDEKAARRKLIEVGVPVPDPRLDPEGSAARPNAVDPNFRFAAHGTACAGLVGANANFADIVPAKDDKKTMGCNEVKEPAPDAKADPEPRKPNPNAIRYSGVDPFAKIIPINTVYSHEYWPLTSALLYAMLCDADVILLPRSVEDMIPGEAESDDPRLTRFRNDRVRGRHKDVFEALLRDVSQEIPVVVAAGNSGPGPLEYPARLSQDNNAAPQLIVVGAVTAFGQRATYCAGRRQFVGESIEDEVFIYAPSDDREEMSTDDVRYDELSWRGSKIGGPGLIGSGRYCPYKVLAIDTPGPYGYASDPHESRDLNDPGIDPGAKNEQKQSQNRPGSLYSLFGGTSAASSIVAGVVSQMHRAAGRRLSAGEVSCILRRTYMTAKDVSDPNAQSVLQEHPGKITNAIDAKKAIETAATYASG